MSDLKRKGILLLLSVLMLVSAGAYLTFAWYTKVTSVSGMEFDAAQWEFTANYEVSDFSLNVNSYTTSNKGMAAPGTAGAIPIVLGATNSHTDVDYQIWIDKSTMSPEFQERIYFYYKDKDSEETKLFLSDTPIKGTIKAKETYTEYIYWKWIYEAKDIPGRTTEVTAAEDLEFNTFDTAVGKNPDLYEPLMSATLSIVGTQSSPVTSNSPTS